MSHHLPSGGVPTSTDLHTSLQGIAIVPAQLYGAPPRDFLREGVNTSFTLGENTVERPIKLDTPIMLGGVPAAYKQLASRRAMIHGAGLAKTVVDCGSLGLLADEKELAGTAGARTLIPITPSRLGAKIPVLSECDAICLSLIPGNTGSTEPDLGNVILPEQLAPELVDALGLDPVGPLFGPPRMLDMDTPRDLNNLVNLVREITGYELPVLVKIGPGRVFNDIRIAVKAKPDAIVLDCSQDTVVKIEHGASFACAKHHGDETPAGLPAIGVLTPAAQALKESEAEKAEVKLIFMGDLRTGADIFKVMAFGAAGVMLTHAPLCAAGILPDSKHPASSQSLSQKSDKKTKAASKTSPSTVMTQIEPEKSGKIIAGFIDGALTELKSLVAGTGHDSVSDITTEDLRALCYNTAAITGLKLIGYEKSLTMWEH